MNPPFPSSRPNPSSPTWGLLNFSQLYEERKPGFYPATGYHIYCELRPIAAFEETKDNAGAKKFVRIVDKFAKMGEEAAKDYGLGLLELQGRVLHFFKPGPDATANTDSVIDFVHEFTQTAYDELRDDMGKDWHGFASAFDHGRCILLNHSSQHTDSTISLGPSANGPAKRLFNHCPAGHVSAPGRLVTHLVRQGSQWVDIDLKNRAVSPTRTRALHERFAGVRELIRKSDKTMVNFSALPGQNILHMTPEHPLHLTGATVRFDLDGFSKLVAQAFDRGDQAVAAIARSFKAVMDYAEKIAQAHQPCLMLPWAGDCATFLLPEVPEKLPRWLEFCMDWLDGSINGLDSPLATLADIKGTRWAAGAARGTTGSLVAATSYIHGKPFLFAGGWPHAIAKKAQESALGNEVAIDMDDHQRLSGAARKLFEEKNDEGFWVADHPTKEGLQKLAVELAASLSAPRIVTTSATAPQRPPNRPYFRGK